MIKLHNLRFFRSEFSALSRKISFSQLLKSGNSSGKEKNEAELQLMEKLKVAFPDSTKVEVDDVSGGCGAMFEVKVVSASFKGIRTVQQHKMVNEALKEEIKAMHGIRIATAATDQ